MTHVTCRMTAKNRDHLRNPTLGNLLFCQKRNVSYPDHVHDILAPAFDDKATLLEFRQNFWRLKTRFPKLQYVVDSTVTFRPFRYNTGMRQTLRQRGRQMWGQTAQVRTIETA